MILSYLLFIIFVGWGILNFRKSFFTYIAVKIVFHDGVCLKASAPTLTLELALNVVFVLLYVFNKKNIVKENDKFPLFWCSILVFISYSVSSYYSEFPLIESIRYTFQILINDFFIIYVLWKLLQDNKDLKFLLNAFIAVFFVVTLYGCFEFITSLNPIIDFQMSSLGEFSSNKIWKTTSLRGGFVRAQSLMPISITFGSYCALFFVFIMYYYSKFKEYFEYKRFVFPLIVTLLLIGVFISNSRSPIFCLLIGSICLISVKKIFSPRYIASVILLLPLLFVLITVFGENITSVFSDNPDVAGSSVEMRITQMDVVLEAFLESPIWGLGIKAIRVLMEEHPILLGAESIWFWILAERGLVGVISYLSIYLNILFKFFRSRIKSFVLFFSLSWGALATMTTTPGLGISFFFTLMFIMVKSNQYSNKKLNYYN